MLVCKVDKSFEPDKYKEITDQESNQSYIYGY